MKFCVKLCMACALFCGVVMAGSTAQAQNPGGFGFGGPFGLNGYGGVGNSYFFNQQSVPYFALHPPVYYSCPVPRPYGFSPFALPPGWEPAESRVLPNPEPIANPYFKPSLDDAKPESENVGVSWQTAMRAREIVNPYFQSADSPSSPQLARNGE
jgi:hypothetical protein